MAKEKKDVVEETTNKVKEPKKQKTTKVDLRKKAKDLEDSVVKVDLSKPPKQSSEEIKQQSANEEEVVVINEEAKV